MPDKTQDIQFAITTEIRDDEVTLEELNRRLFAAHPSLQDDPRWIGVAVSKMLGDGRLVPVGWDGKGAFEFNQVVKAGQ